MQEAPMEKQTALESNAEYEAFVDKFKPKLTTDDCYTPPEVYEVVKNWRHPNLVARYKRLWID